MPNRMFKAKSSSFVNALDDTRKSVLECLFSVPKDSELVSIQAKISGDITLGTGVTGKFEQNDGVLDNGFLLFTDGVRSLAIHYRMMLVDSSAGSYVYSLSADLSGLIGFGTELTFDFYTPLIANHSVQSPSPVLVIV